MNHATSRYGEPSALSNVRCIRAARVWFGRHFRQGVGVDVPEQGYVSLIAQRLAETTGETVRTVNLAVSGAKARDVLCTQLPQLATMRTLDLVTCVIGGNDVAWAPIFRSQSFMRTMNAIAAQLPDHSVMGSVPHFMHWPFEGRARRANSAIWKAANAHDLGTADIYTATKKVPLREYMRTFAGDYFHPNETGHQLWADAIWAQLVDKKSDRRRII